MTSALVYLNGNAPPPLASDLQAMGIHVLGVIDECSKLVQEVLRQSPDVLVCHDALPGDELFRAFEIISETAARPVILFTVDADAAKIARAVEVGVHAYVVGGYGQGRLRPLVHLAQARFAREQALEARTRDVSSRFEERKMVDRAKGILMRARQVSDDDAFQILRTASMHTNQRLGQVSQHIIHSARFAEDVNRSGQLRMLSQRLVKLALLQQAGVEGAGVQVRLKESVQRADATIAALGKSLSQPTFGDLLGQVVVTWTRLKAALQDAPSAGSMARIDELAEQLLQETERMTTSLESAGAMAPLELLNRAARQRMLSQRYAKFALLRAIEVQGDKPGTARVEAGMAEASSALDKTLAYLNELPLTSREIRVDLEEAGLCWNQMKSAALGGRAEFPTLAITSEDLLAIFERLSGHYEQSMQMLMG